MGKKIVFRADGNSDTGLGHLYRLFALVEIYKNHYEFTFVTKTSSIKTIFPSDYPVTLIPETISIADEPIWLHQHFNPSEYLIIADGYQFKSNYQKQLKDEGYYLMYIDDLAKEHMFANIVVNHSPDSEALAFQKENYTKLALGTDYAMLRPSFLDIKIKPVPSPPLKTGFICFGGADKFNFTLKATKELLTIPEIESIKIIVGAAYNFKELFQLEKTNSKIEIYKNLDEENLKNLMNNCTFGIAPASTILFELISVNMYLFSGFYVDNQQKAYEKLVQEKVIYGLGDFNNYTFDTIKTHFSKLSYSVIKEQIERQKILIDGNQKVRFLNLIKNIE
ncbi:UDP-2,4-diacetamido-2,4,6-trideoxy-beta-L-altropyranose hydrolase [Mariniflexile sp.]|uniref:UDP-2,4-diacetamido-2,4, 6-trideoxy-beta-L-altropyranose hydrolase n=1 Tax=Mariniflexile sp. TaxID=1979402 RepID=UPI0040476956